jgi:hypothetical protein
MKALANGASVLCTEYTHDTESDERTVMPWRVCTRLVLLDTVLTSGNVFILFLVYIDGQCSTPLQNMSFLTPYLNEYGILY